MRSGWRRGFVFYLIDLVGFAASVLAAVRFHEVPSAAFEFFGLSGQWPKVVGGLAIFLPLIALTAIVGSRLSRAMYKPGLFMLNRVLGAIFATALVLSVVVVGTLFVERVTLPFGLERFILRSTIGPQLVDAAQPAIEFLDERLGLDLDAKLRPDGEEESRSETGRPAPR